MRDALVGAIHGLRYVINCTGYGVLRAEEPITSRGQASRRPSPCGLSEWWSRRITFRRQQISRRFVLLSQQCAACVRPLTSGEHRATSDARTGRADE